MDHPHFTELADSTGLRKSASEPGSAMPRQRKYLQHIGDQWCAPANGEWFETVNPANGEPWALIPHGTAADAERAVAAARCAFESGTWHDLNPTARGELLRRVATYLEAHIEELAPIEARDNGRRQVDLLPQLRYLPKYFHYYAGLADKIEGTVIPNDVPGVFNYTRHEPLGVVVAITPWNSPLMLAAWKLAPALAAGNTVVLKPSEHASASTLELALLLELGGLPPGVVNVVTGFGQGVGSALVSHPDVAKITFTGSDASGRHIAAAAGQGLKRVTLELGGKSPQLVFDDADMDTAVHGVLAGIFMGLGQSCIAGSRLLVQNAIHDRFVERLVAGMQGVRIGDPFDPHSQLGPIANQPQFEKVLAFIAQAREDGATCVLGGQAAHPANCPTGWYLEPTIFTNVTPDMQLYRDEVFGPVLAVTRFRDEDEAVRMANDTRFGLAAGVWTTDMARSVRLSQRIAAGTVYVNTYRSVSALSPVGGYKHSGYGRENGIDAIREFLQVKSVWMGLAPVPNPFPQDRT
ncbi:MAG: aldehyde dehydrogenase [Rhodoferax sp.]|nr:aldehyde dehydrogenase [Rhodoferax sp.]